MNNYTEKIMALKTIIWINPQMYTFLYVNYYRIAEKSKCLLKTYQWDYWKKIELEN